MPFLTQSDIEQRKRMGVSMKKLNCGWNLPEEMRALIIIRLRDWEPKNRIEERNKWICFHAFVFDECAAQIARLNDPRFVGMSSRNNGAPLTSRQIQRICLDFAPEISKLRKERRESSAEERKHSFMKDQRMMMANFARTRQSASRPYLCSVCGTESNLELHHIIPISEGGPTQDWNLIYLCKAHHRKLHNEMKYRKESL